MAVDLVYNGVSIYGNRGGTGGGGVVTVVVVVAAVCGVDVSGNSSISSSGIRGVVLYMAVVAVSMIVMKPLAVSMVLVSYIACK